jgi:hypothetical protein
MLFNNPSHAIHAPSTNFGSSGDWRATRRARATLCRPRPNRTGRRRRATQAQGPTGGGIQEVSQPLQAAGRGETRAWGLRAARLGAPATIAARARGPRSHEGECVRSNACVLHEPVTTAAQAAIASTGAGGLRKHQACVCRSCCNTFPQTLPPPMLAVIRHRRLCRSAACATQTRANRQTTSRRTRRTRAAGGTRQRRMRWQRPRGRRRLSAAA